MNIPKAKKSGLSVLLGNLESQGRLVNVPVDQVVRNEAQPRTQFDSAALASLAASIEAQGVIQPIVVREVAGGNYQIIAGERRWLASQQAGLKTVPAVVQTADDKSSLVMALAENLVRENLNPLEAARCYAALVDEFGMSIADVAKSVGKSRPAVSNTLRLLELPDDVIAAIESRLISEGHGRALLQISDRAIQRRLANEVIERSMSVRALEFAVRSVAEAHQEKQKNPSKQAKSNRIHELDHRLSQLSEQLDVKSITARSSSRSTALEIRCHDREQLMALVDLLEHAGINAPA